MVIPRSLPQRLEDVHHFDAGAAVQIPGGLIRQQNRRLIQQRPRNRHALLLAAGELIGMMLGAILQADGASAASRAFPPFGAEAEPPLLYSSGSSTFSSAEVRGSRLKP